MLDARAAAVRAERDRRLAEIADKHDAKHTLRPYRAHVLWLPALRIGVDVRRGERRYPLVLDWLVVTGRFADVRCPSCGGAGPLAAGKSALGCTGCQPGRPTASPEPTGSGRPAPRPRVGISEAAETIAKAGSAAAGGVSGARAGSAPAGGVSGAKAGSAVAGGVSGAKAGSSTHGVSARPTVRLPARRVVEIGDRVALKFWRTVAEGENRKVARLCAPDSPAAVSVRLFGATGPLWAIGAEPGFVPEGMTTGTEPDPHRELQLTRGTLSGRNRQYRFGLEWNARANVHLVSEVHQGSWWFLAHRPAVPPRAPLCEVDPVVDLLLGAAEETYLLLRAVTSWWRIPDRDGLVDRYGGRPVAAALHRGASCWSRTGAPGGYAAFVAK